MKRILTASLIALALSPASALAQGFYDPMPSWYPDPYGIRQQRRQDYLDRERREQTEQLEGINRELRWMRQDQEDRDHRERMEQMDRALDSFNYDANPWR